MDDGNTEEIKKYLSDELEVLTSKNFYIKTGNSTVDTIINSKQILAKNKGIYMTVNAGVPNDCKISSIHLASILGNLIDNAIEAVEKEDNPYIHVQISVIKESFLLIKIVNKCSKSDLSNQTTKENKLFHGIGLKSVKNTGFVFYRLRKKTYQIRNILHKDL